MKPIKTTNASAFSRALRRAIDQMLFDGIEDAEEQVPEDGGAEVLLVHLDGGKQLLVTIGELGA